MTTRVRVNRADNSKKDASSSSRPRRESTSPPTVPTWLAQCDSEPAVHDTRHHPNGQIPASELCELPSAEGHFLRLDAARAWWRLGQAFSSRFGASVCITDAYRSYQTQAVLYGAKPGLAAAPGTSNHGWGVALDLCGGVEDYNSAPHQWLRRHGKRFGWMNPQWAQADGSQPEPWHWEYEGVR